MAKLYFIYGAMGSSKTANALMVRYNYIDRGKNPLMLKPEIENRDGEKIIKSRIGLSAECEYAEDIIKNFDTIQKEKRYDAIIVDEAQFLAKEYIDHLSDIVDTYNIPVMCYGLRTDFKGELFEGSKRLMEIADSIEEIKTVCWCGNKATFNARIHNGKIIRNGEQIVIGGDDTYISLCRKHYKSGLIQPIQSRSN